MTWEEALKTMREWHTGADFGQEVNLAICEQIEANRIAIEELLARNAQEDQHRADCQRAFEEAMSDSPYDLSVGKKGFRR